MNDIAGRSISLHDAHATGAVMATEISMNAAGPAAPATPATTASCWSGAPKMYMPYEMSVSAARVAVGLLVFQAMAETG